MSAEDLFQAPLQPDPTVALSAADLILPAITPGPVHGAQFIVEIAGPKSVLASQAHLLMRPDWQNALGRPELWAMAPADDGWRLMNAADTGSYDSIALAWDLLTVQGELSMASARTLLQTAERFANSVERRAFPFPSPEDVDRLVQALLQAREAFDIGVELYVQGPLPFAERDVWSACAALGFDLSGEGLFVWRSSKWPEPLLTVAPVEEGRVFSLGQVQRAETHEALSLGFSLPLSPDPARVLEKAFEAALVLARRLGGLPYDDEGRSLDGKVKTMLRNNLMQGIASMRASGLAPGSAICLKLFR